MKPARLIVILFIPFLFSSCSLFKNNPVKSIQIVSDKEANNNKQTEVDVVFIFGSSEDLPKTTEEWFSGHKGRILNAPDGYKVVSMRVPPALIQEVELPSKYGKATKILAYVNFHKSGGQPPLDLTRYSNPVIVIKDDHYSLSWRR